MIIIELPTTNQSALTWYGQGDAGHSHDQLRGFYTLNKKSAPPPHYGSFGWKRGHFQNLTLCSETPYMTSVGFGDMFEGDSAAANFRSRRCGAERRV